jgi:hypothetical protein
MSSQSGTRAIAAVVVIASAVAGCSEMYFDRRQTIALGAGDAIATNKVTQMVDPWPAASANNNIAFNGQLMQSAQDRYNRGKVITPVLPTSASKDYQSMQSSAASSQSATGQSTSATPAVAVKGPGGPNGSNGP